VATAEILHNRRPKKFYSELRTSQEHGKANSVLAMSFEYMNNLQAARNPFKRPIVFCVQDMKTDKLVIYLYYEGPANKRHN
jgi:hypothetical protein